MADGVIEIVFALCWLIALRKRNVSNESKASLT
jgi:hypothetical protein